MKNRIFLFGEAEKGELCTPLRFATLEALYDKLGNPPSESLGIDYAVQTLLHKKELIFYRVREEGFSKNDYMRGVKLLYNHGNKFRLSAICIPGVGDRQVIEEIAQICQKMKTLLILSEKDLYDYLTSSGR